MGKHRTYHRVTFLPEGKTIEVEDRKTVFETILEHNPLKIALRFACGAEGICQKCKIRALQEMGPLTPTERGCLSQEELRKGVRLACQARVIQDTDAEIIFKSPFTIELLDEPCVPEDTPGARVVKVLLHADDDGDCRRERIAGAFEGADAGDELILQTEQQCELLFNRGVTCCTAVMVDHELVCIEEGDTIDCIYAVAVDLGITTLAASLLNLSTGRKIAVVTDTNPQIDVAADLETRIAMVGDDPLNLEILNEELVLRIDILISELCSAREVLPASVYAITISGVTGMLHLFLKNAPAVLEQSHLMCDVTPDGILAGGIGIKSSENARLYSLPVISSYAGADVTASILATQLHRSCSNVLLIDLGTNPKAVMQSGGVIAAISTTGGGAFEGMGIHSGMRPEAGAINRVVISDDVHLSVVGESLPRGIDGCGLMMLAAEMLRLGLLGEDGRFAAAAFISEPSNLVSSRFATVNGSEAFCLYRDDGRFHADVYVTQDDFLRLAQAKAAVSVLVKHLLDWFNLTLNTIDRVFIAGAFGDSIPEGTFSAIGIMPSFMQDRLCFVGNTAKTGAQMALLDRHILHEAEEIVQKTVCLEQPHDSEKEVFVSFCADFRQ